MDRFGGDVDWSGHEPARANLWHRQLHIFLHPFYYVEYGIAQLGALQVWANSKKDKARRFGGTIIAVWRWAVRARCRNCLRRRVADSISAAKPSSP